MFSAKVTYRNLGLSDEQVSIAVRVEELAAKLLDAGLPVECVDEWLLNLVKKDSRKLGKTADLLRAHPGIFDEEVKK
jgi:hypothetical protein